MATNDLPAPPTACQVLATLRHAATAIATAAGDVEACTGHPLSDDDLGGLHNARRVTRIAQGTVNQAMCELRELLDAVSHVALDDHAPPPQRGRCRRFRCWLRTRATGHGGRQRRLTAHHKSMR